MTENTAAPESASQALDLPLTPGEPRDFTPVSAMERIQLIDILRGFALFGVLVANMKGFSLPIQAYFGFGGEWPLSQMDKAVDLFILFAIKGKFIALFSFLFGLGLSVQLMRAQAKGVSVVPRYMRRLTVLLIFGGAHVVFFWIGDILHTYALVGFVLLLFRNLSLKALERSIVICIMALMIGGFVGTIIGSQRPPDPAKQKQQKEVTNRAMQEQLRIYTRGTYLEQVISRCEMWKEFYLNPGTLFYFTDLLSLFLMGLYAGKRRIFQEIEQNRAFIRKCMWFGLACGLAGLVRFLPPTPTLVWARFLRGLLTDGTGQYLFIFYAAGMTLVYHNSRQWASRLTLLAPVGRMALSNYLTHTLACTTIFYGYGLGFFGKMGSTVGLALSIAIYATQIPFSAWWLSRYQFGPAEWLWRSLTYGKIQTMRVLPIETTKASSAIA